MPFRHINIIRWFLHLPTLRLPLPLLLVTAIAMCFLSMSNAASVLETGTGSTTDFENNYGCQEFTTSGYQYRKSFPLIQGVDGLIRVSFKVRCKSDAHIAFSADREMHDPIYEIVLGAASNNYSDVRRGRVGKSQAATKSIGVLSQDEYRGFWVHIKDGDIEVGKEGNDMPFLHWHDPVPLHVNYVSFSTWTQIIGKWKYECDEETEIMWHSNMTGMWTPTDQLKYSLLLNYDKHVRPVLHHKNTTVVNFGLSVLHITMDEATSSMILDCWLSFTWQDEKLKWNESDYSGIDVLRIPPHEIWQPDILPYNAAGSDVDLIQNTLALVYPSGSVLWIPPARLVTYCQINLRKWPYDKQECIVKIGSWTHDGDNIDLRLQNENNSLKSSIDFSDMMIENSEWKVLDSKAEKNVKYYPCCSEPYHDLTFFFHVGRRSPAYIVFLIIPIFVIMGVTLGLFWLPPGSSEKITIGVANLAIVVLVLLFCGHSLPAMGDHVPVLVVVYAVLLILIGLSLLISIITINYTRSVRISPPPWILKSIFNGFLGTFLGLSSIPSMALGNDRHSTLSNEDLELKGHDSLQRRSEADVSAATGAATSHWHPNAVGAADQMKCSREWAFVSTGIDRLTFLIFCVLFGILLAVLL